MFRTNKIPAEHPAHRLHSGLSSVLALLVFGLLFGCSGKNGPQVFNIQDFGAKSHGSISTVAVQSAIDACNSAGGGTVYVPAGEFTIGSVILRSNINLYLESGAVIKGSSNLDDYGSDGPARGMFYARNVSNVSVTGFGAIDGNGTHFFNPDVPHVGKEKDYDVNYTRQGQDFMHERFGFEDGPISFDRRPGMQFVFMHCQNVTLRDFTLKDSPSWSVRFGYCDNVSVDNVKIFNNLLIPNSDGIHCTTSRNVRFSNCDFRCGDDALIVATRQWGGPDDEPDYLYGNKTGISENITVTNCVLQSRSSGIRIGYGKEPVRNCTFENIVIYDSNRGIGVFSREPDSDIENILFSNILITNRLHKGHWWGKGEPIHVSTIPRFKESTTGSIRNVRFHNIVAESETGIVVWGVPEKPIQDLEFKNVKLRIKESKIHEIYGGNFDLRPTNSFETAIFQHDIPAFYAQYVDGLTIAGSQFEWSGNFLPFFTYGLEASNVSRLIVRDSILNAVNGYKDINLTDCPRAVIR
jgi:polygalacturonase